MIALKGERKLLEELRMSTNARRTHGPLEYNMGCSKRGRERGAYHLISKPIFVSDRCAKIGT